MIKDPREYIWAVPFIGGILILISVLTPSYYAELMGIEEYHWMWGLSYTSLPGYESQTVFIVNEEPIVFTMPIFLIGIIPLSIILIGSVALLTSANAVRTGKSEIKNRENLWIIMGITMIIAAIIYIIGIDIAVMNFVEYQLEEIYGYVPAGLPDFWDTYDPGFAIIAPFLGAVLSIGGSIASKVIQKREVPIYAHKKQGGIITKKTIGQTSHKINFCPECGHQILYDGSRFCSNCGKAIKF